MNFTAIDFETATGYRNSACAVGLVKVENGEIIDTYYSLIRPPQNYYSYRNIAVHGIEPHETEYAPEFHELINEIQSFVHGRTLIAHNAVFDRSVLNKTIEYHDIDTDNFQPAGWECTLKIYRAKGFKPCKLSDCCRHLNIPLNHHEALSDAIACAKLYLAHLNNCKF